MAALVLAVFWFALRLRAAPPLRRRQGLPATSAPPADEVIAHARALAKIVNATASRSFGERQCLARSLALQWMLRRRGVESELRIGVRRSDGALSAHAWIECGGIPVNDDVGVASAYAVFTEPLRLADFED